MQIDVPQLVRAEMQDKRHDRQMERRLMYVPPLDGSTDPHREFDAWVASQIMAILDKEHPGYPWFAASNAEQGIVYFSIPLLMGDSLRYLIKLGDWSDLSPTLVKRCAGELLERMNLPLSGFEAASFLKARDNKHLLDFADAGKRHR